MAQTRRPRGAPAFPRRRAFDAVACFRVCAADHLVARPRDRQGLGRAALEVPPREPRCHRRRMVGAGRELDPPTRRNKAPHRNPPARAAERDRSGYRQARRDRRPVKDAELKGLELLHGQRFE
ncbi:hypothetical protein DFJ74DRAFT_774827, partial [Hyaloraphidium curvatum]